MAVNDTVRGLKGAITRLKEENARLEVNLGAEIKLRLAGDEGLQEMARQRDVAVREAQRAVSEAQADKALADGLGRELDRVRASEREALEKLRTSEAERHRLNGYIQRVAEDDAVRDGSYEVADRRTIPRRPAAPLSPVESYGGAGSAQWGVDFRDNSLISERGRRRY
ncbi:hypothetical protein V5F49_11165 [Xanthobacter sp. V3C-3]|uniref:hypothetical protein n=1 Tax=Xanthobacter lutulentifluminis TaxID=3119935 RepID=UPI003726B840